MMEHPGIDTLHDLLDEELGPADAEPVRAHLAGCPACRAELDQLRSAVEAVRDLPREGAAPAHLWPGIRSRMDGASPAPVSGGGDEGAGGGADVLPFPGRSAGPRRLSLSVPQLAAAAAVVALLSAGTVWTALRSGGTEPTPTAAAVEVVPPGGAALRAASVRQGGYEQVVRELELLVTRGRAVLAPETLATLERSLGTVDAAMADVRSALADDPGSELLRRMLVGHQTTKLRVLRQAVTAIEARS